MSDPKLIALTTPEQQAAYQQLRTAVAAETDLKYLTDGEIVRAAALAYCGREGWDSVGKEDGRGGSVRADRLAPGGDLATD
ncbi:hypothetical protein GJ633_04095 [Halorubrum sp. CBA1125]|uniref:hypothetical protein n=1 Tax=Halorubrum sp. CBA1125 TaxID=2668072 RepID=UPI0012E8096F|nr:hypothetical protein [Halorubrum sp. CBA1125]MUW13933.1 hypothetical protein [Halorubrum sp. CBA1125]